MENVKIKKIKETNRFRIAYVEFHTKVSPLNGLNLDRRFSRYENKSLKKRYSLSQSLLAASEGRTQGLASIWLVEKYTTTNDKMRLLSPVDILLIWKKTKKSLSKYRFLSQERSPLSDCFFKNDLKSKVYYSLQVGLVRPSFHKRYLVDKYLSNLFKKVWYWFDPIRPNPPSKYYVLKLFFICRYYILVYILNLNLTLEFRFRSLRLLRFLRLVDSSKVEIF